MIKRNFIDYKQWIINNSKKLNYEIISIDDESVTIKCLKCGAIKKYEIHSIYTNYKNKDNITIHNESCSTYFNKIIKEELGSNSLKRFRAHYRYARERCCNPNCKDYARYNGKWHFEDYTEYVLDCYEQFKKSLIEYGEDCQLTIDRINGHKGYEIGNVRFVPIKINSQNKDIVIPVMGVNLNTKQVISANSIGELAEFYFDKNKISAIHSSIKNNSIYNNTWKIFYTIKTQSTIESN